MADRLALDGYRLPGDRPPLARAADAPSAHAAADRIESTGRAAESMRKVLDGVRRFPGLTSKQLAAAIGLERHDVARRLSEAFRRHLVERIEPAEGDLVWFAAGAAPESPSASAHERRRARVFAAAVSWDAAISRARAAFRAAGRAVSEDDVRGAAAIERRLALVYSGRLIARMIEGGRVAIVEGHRPHEAEPVIPPEGGVR